MSDDHLDHCRHCGLAIRSTDAVNWLHTERPARHLHRCQAPGFAYGYEAIPTFDDGPCDCWACLQFGQRSATTKGTP